MIEGFLVIPTFLWQVFYMLFGSVAPLLLILWLVRLVLRSTKKLAHSVVR